MKLEKFEELLGQTITKIVGAEGDDVIVFTLSDGHKYMLFHSQDCCESVSVEDIIGDLNDLIDSPILLAEEVDSNENPADANPETIQHQDSFTWTFYKLSTIKGSVTIRWYGESNGYYSESVTFGEMAA